MERIGTVKWFNEVKGYGFIERNDGPDVYVHHSDILMTGYRTLRPGSRVAFDLDEGPEGLLARRVNPQD